MKLVVEQDTRFFWPAYQLQTIHTDTSREAARMRHIVFLVYQVVGFEQPAQAACTATSDCLRSQRSATRRSLWSRYTNH